MEYFVHIGERELRVVVDGDSIHVDGEPLDVELAPDGASPVRSVRVGGRSLRVMPARNGRGDWTLGVEGRESRVRVLDAGQEAIRKARRAAGADAGSAALHAPMPGLVVRVEVEVGQVVEEGEGVIIVEAMKMENELRAERAGRIRAILVEVGATVDKDQLLVEFEAPEEDG